MSNENKRRFSVTLGKAYAALAHITV